uniref:Retrotransposon gag domain-containing protein n=1 Tax=Tanacetum cinerariifolium TaxID=118510 RepID=A0A6L2N343_TANCI|nr:hypothetical protein [Tanacetum cinerariifolium]
MIENLNLEEHSHPVVTMSDQRTMAELLRAACRWLEKEPPRSIHTWEDLVSKIINEFFPPSRTTNLRNKISNFQQRFDESFHEAWDRYKDLLRACPHHGFTELHQLDTFYNALNPVDQDSLNAAAEIAKLTHAVNQQTSAVTTAITAMLKQFQATPHPAPVKAVEETCVTCGGAHPHYLCLAAGGNTFPELEDNIQGYVSAVAVNYNQGNPGYRPPSMANQIRPPAPAQQNQNVHLNELEKVKRMNEANMKAMQTQINMVKNKLRNEMKSFIRTSLSNQTNKIKNIMASLLQMNTASTSGPGSLPSNTIANPKGELKAITTRSGLVIDVPTVPTPSQSINPEVDERVEETFTNPNLTEYTIKVTPPPVQKYKPPSQQEYVVHQRDPRHSNISYPSRMLKQKHQEKDKVQIQKFWQMFKQLHINITLADALILMPKYQKLLKALLSNKEKLQELANTPLIDNCSAVILKKLPKKLGDPRKFLILCGFSYLKCKVLADLGASINLMSLSVWKKLGLPELIPTRMTFELANRAICTPIGIARDVFVSVGKFIFPADFVIVDYESDFRVPLILGRPFLRTAHALIDVRGEEMILRDGCSVLDLDCEDFLEAHFPNQPSGNPTFSSHPELNSPEVNNDIFDSEGCNVLSEKLLDLDYTKDLHPPLHDNPLSGNTTYFSNPLLEEFADELPPEYDDNLQFDIENVYDDPFDSKGEKIKESKLVIDELDLLFNFHPLSEYNSFIPQDFSRADALPSTNNEDKIFNPGILIQGKPVEIITRVVQDKKLAISNASLVLEDFNPPFYEPLFFKEVPKSKMLLLFSSDKEEKVFKPGIHTFEKVHSYFIPELSHQGYKVFKINQIFKGLTKIFFSTVERTPTS